MKIIIKTMSDCIMVLPHDVSEEVPHYLDFINIQRSYFGLKIHNKLMKI